MDRGGFAIHQWTEAVLHLFQEDRGGFERYYPDKLYYSRWHQEQFIVDDDWGRKSVT